MDTKALAKSKRAHSYHHSKKHSTHQASKTASIASDNKKPAGKQAKVKPPQPRPLPSNWERYDENPDSASEEAQSSSSRPTEVVLPKSKGADFAHLISEAKDQSRANCSSDVVPLFDDFINDFAQDFGPMLLAAKGQSILSWVDDDDFEFEGKTSTSLEAPFLSLNLNALAEQLAKAKLSERCFLEPDRFPLELLDDELQARGEDKHDPQTDSKPSSLGYNQESSESENLHVKTSEEELKPLNQENKDDNVQSQGAITSISPKSNSERTVGPTDENPSIFQASSAEAELDMLLSSFSETSILDSSSSSSTVKNGMNVMKSANNYDDIDNLLEETANVTNRDATKAIIPDAIVSSTSNPSSKSTLLDDFDSWLDTI